MPTASWTKRRGGNNSSEPVVSVVVGLPQQQRQQQQQCDGQPDESAQGLLPKVQCDATSSNNKVDPSQEHGNRSKAVAGADVVDLPPRPQQQQHHNRRLDDSAVGLLPKDGCHVPSKNDKVDSSQKRGNISKAVVGVDVVDLPQQRQQQRDQCDRQLDDSGRGLLPKDDCHLPYKIDKLDSSLKRGNKSKAVADDDVVDLFQLPQQQKHRNRQLDDSVIGLLPEDGRSVPYKIDKWDSSLKRGNRSKAIVDVDVVNLPQQRQQQQQQKQCDWQPDESAEKLLPKLQTRKSSKNNQFDPSQKCRNKSEPIVGAGVDDLPRRRQQQQQQQRDQSDGRADESAEKLLPKVECNVPSKNDKYSGSPKQRGNSCNTFFFKNCPAERRPENVEKNDNGDNNSSWNGESV